MTQLEQRINEARQKKQIDHLELILKQLNHDLLEDAPKGMKPNKKADWITENEPQIDTAKYEKDFPAYKFEVQTAETRWFTGEKLYIDRKDGQAHMEFYLANVPSMLSDWKSINKTAQPDGDGTGLDKRSKEMQGDLKNQLDYFEAELMTLQDKYVNDEEEEDYVIQPPTWERTVELITKKGIRGKNAYEKGIKRVFKEFYLFDEYTSMFQSIYKRVTK